MAGQSPPITALCVLAGADAPVRVPAAHPLVPATSFLGWKPSAPGAAGVAMVELSTYQMVAAFGRCFRASRTPADLPAARRVNPLILGLSGPCWARALNEYIASGLLGHTMSSRADLRNTLDDLTIADPAALAITAADWQLGEDTAGIPPLAQQPGLPAVPAVRARGRAGQPGYVPGAPRVPAVPPAAAVPGRPALDAAIEYLTFASVIELEDGDAPWGLISYVAGLLGPCLSQAERNNRSAQVQLAGRSLASGCAVRYGTLATDPHAIAADLRDFLKIIAPALPDILLSAGLDPLELRAEGRDAMLYTRDAAGRRHVEESRVHLFGQM